MLSGMAALPLMAQDNLEELLSAEGGAAANDSKLLIENYLTPLMKGFGFGMANGWYNTAKPHKTLGVDLTVTVNAAYVPDKDLFYDAESINMESFTLVQGYEGTSNVPTIFGPDFTPVYEHNSTGEEIQGPPGLGLEEEFGFNAIPVPMATLGIGIVKNTDLKLRFIPKINNEDMEFKMFGIGVMHDIKQYIPGIKALPFDLSVMLGYTDLDLDIFLNENDPSQVATFDANAWTFQGLISKKFSVLTVYGGLGFNRVRSELNMLGTYSVSNDTGQTVTITDPIKDMGFPAGGPRATVGARLKLLILTLHADYTLQEYNVLSVGVGLSVR